MKEERVSTSGKLLTSAKILGFLLIIASLASFFLTGTDELSGANIAIIPLHGEIYATGHSGFSSDIVSSDEIVLLLDKADSDPGIKAIILDINSPGGSPVGSDEIGQKVKTLNKTTVAVIREVGASGSYWIASSADYVFASRLSLVGSIGVIGSYLDFSGLMRDYNVTYQRYVSSDLKDMGSPFKEPSEKERKVMQKLIDDMNTMFIIEVAGNRNMSEKIVREIATGQVYLGTEAKELGLVDYLGSRQDAIAFLESKLNITAVPSTLVPEKSWMDLIPTISYAGKTGKFINPGSNKLSLA